MTKRSPVFLGTYDAANNAEDTEDYGIDVTNDLDGDIVVSVDLTLEDSSGEEVASAILAQSILLGVITYRVDIPTTVGTYTVTAAVTYSDDRHITYEAHLPVV